jgi:hypothetical protein
MILSKNKTLNSMLSHVQQKKGAYTNRHLFLMLIYNFITLISFSNPLEEHLYG